MPGRDPTPNARRGIYQESTRRHPRTRPSSRPATLPAPCGTSGPANDTAAVGGHIDLGEPSTSSFSVGHVKALCQSSSASDSPQTPQNAVRLFQTGVTDQTNVTGGNDDTMIPMVDFNPRQGEPDNSNVFAHSQLDGVTGDDQAQAVGGIPESLEDKSKHSKKSTTSSQNAQSSGRLSRRQNEPDNRNVIVHSQLDGETGDDPEQAVGGIPECLDDNSKHSKKSTTSSPNGQSSARLSRKDAHEKCSNAKQGSGKKQEKPLPPKETRSSSTYKLRKNDKKKQ